MIIVPGRIIKDNNGKEYIVEKQIGSGGFGNVFRIKRMADGSIFALKTLLSEFEDENSLKSFKNEIELSKGIESDNVIKYLCTNDGEMNAELPPYIIMEYADGGTLNEYIEKYKNNSESISNEELKSIFLQLIQGMKAINSKIVHRDIKPENILIKNNILKISDFGLAKIANNRTRISTFKGYGTALYVAPEGWKNDNNTIQMDIYSMGIVFYQLATLKLPYNLSKNCDLEKIMNAHLYENPINPLSVNNKLAPTISSIILKMLEKSIKNRFKSWEEIEKYLENDNIEEKPFNNILRNMVANRVAKDNSESQKRLEVEKKKHEEEEFCKLVRYQFSNDVYNPLKEFIDTFNNLYPNKNISLTPFSIGNLKNLQIDVDIKLVSGEYILIKLVPILESNFIRDVTINDFGEKYTKKELKMPLLRKKKIKAWGGVYLNNGIGFNILLVEKENDIYGEWYTMINKNSGLSRQHRIEPFAFEIDELEKEIQYIDVTHIYNTDIKSFDINRIVELIATNN